MFYCGGWLGWIGFGGNESAEAAFHWETGIHDGEAPRSLTINVIEPLTVTILGPIRLIFPPVEKVTGPLRVKKVAVSPVPRLDCIVEMTAVEVDSPMVWAPPILIEELGVTCAVIPLVAGRLVLPKNSLSRYTTLAPAV